MSPCPTPLGTTHSLAGPCVQIPPSVPRLRFRGPPLCPIALSVALPVEMPRSRKVTFQLSVSLAQTPNSSQVQVRFILRKPGSERGGALPTLSTKRGGESLVVFVYFVYNMKRRQGRVRLHESLKSAASGFEHLAVFLCVCARTPCAHLLVPIGRVCRGEMRMGRKKNVQNKQFFPPSFH